MRCRAATTNFLILCSSNRPSAKSRPPGPTSCPSFSEASVALRGAARRPGGRLDGIPSSPARDYPSDETDSKKHYGHGTKCVASHILEPRERVLGGIHWIVINDYPRPQRIVPICGDAPPIPRFSPDREYVPIAIVVGGLVGCNDSLCSLLTRRNLTVRLPFVQRHDRAERPRERHNQVPPGRVRPIRPSLRTHSTTLTGCSIGNLPSQLANHRQFERAWMRRVVIHGDVRRSRILRCFAGHVAA